MFPFSNLVYLDPNFIPASDLMENNRKRGLKSDQMTLRECSRIHVPLWTVGNLLSEAFFCQCNHVVKIVNLKY